MGPRCSAAFVSISAAAITSGTLRFKLESDAIVPNSVLHDLGEIVGSALRRARQDIGAPQSGARNGPAKCAAARPPSLLAGPSEIEGHAELPEKSILAWLSNVTIRSKRPLPITPKSLSLTYFVGPARRAPWRCYPVQKMPMPPSRMADL